MSGHISNLSCSVNIGSISSPQESTPGLEGHGAQHMSCQKPVSEVVLNMKIYTIKYVTDRIP